MFNSFPLTRLPWHSGISLSPFLPEFDGGGMVPTTEMDFLAQTRLRHRLVDNWLGWLFDNLHRPPLESRPFSALTYAIHGAWDAIMEVSRIILHCLPQAMAKPLAPDGNGARTTKFLRRPCVARDTRIIVCIPEFVPHNSINCKISAAARLVIASQDISALCGVLTMVGSRTRPDVLAWAWRLK